MRGYKIYPYQRKSKTIYRLSNLRAFNVPVLNIVSLMTFHPDILQGFVIKPNFALKVARKILSIRTAPSKILCKPLICSFRSSKEVLYKKE